MTTPDAEYVAALKALIEQMPPEYRDRWMWDGNIGMQYYLATARHGRLYVMGFQRLGMQGAQPSFAHRREGDKYHLITKADELAVREVPYRETVGYIDNPFAEWIKTASPDRIAALIEVYDTAVAMAAEAEFSETPWSARMVEAIEKVKSVG